MIEAMKRARQLEAEAEAEFQELLKEQAAKAAAFEAAKKAMIRERATVMYQERELLLKELQKLQQRFGHAPGQQASEAAEETGNDTGPYTQHLMSGLRNGWKAGAGVIREYVKQVLLPELDEATMALLQDLARFQARLREQDPVKAQQKRRFHCGLREVLKGAKRGKYKAVIIATNIDKIEADGGLDDQVEAIVEACAVSCIPVVFGLNRNKLGKAIGTSHKISSVGVTNYDGAHMHYKRMISLLEAAQADWKDSQPK